MVRGNDWFLSRLHLAMGAVLRQLLRLIVSLAALWQLTGCQTNTDEVGTLPIRGEAGLYVDTSGRFFAVANPCDTRLISSVSLIVTDYSTSSPPLFPVMAVTFADPIRTADIAVPLNPLATRFQLLHPAVADPLALSRFNDDTEFLTDVRDPFHFELRFFDENGVEVHFSQQLAARFDSVGGAVNFPSDSYDPAATTCSDGTPARWTGVEARTTDRAASGHV